MRICLTSSAGGHLNQLLKILPIAGKDVFFMTSGKHMEKTLKGYRVYYIEDPVRRPLVFLTNSIKSLSILLKERPDVVITTGAGMVIPTCFIAKIFGAKIIFIETLSRIESPSRTGKIIYPIADLFIVQWKRLLKFYGSKAVYGTPLI
ncbi:polysaccharide biosynthesis protein [archaeon]|nr:MAG: polysaccharide biosynthesis protein [archaeon]